MSVEKSEGKNEVEYYVEFEISGEGLRKVKKVQMEAPDGRSELVQNPLGFDALHLQRDGMTYADLIKKFPEGKYSIKFSPSKFRGISFNLTYDFPSTPVITYPKDGATEVPLSFTITWESVSDIDGLQLNIEDLLSVDLAVGSTSFSVPGGLLQQNTWYSMELIARKSSNENEMLSKRPIDFTTGSE